MTGAAGLEESGALRAALAEAVGARNVSVATGTALSVAPATAAEVAAVIAACRAHGASLVPQGGLTGLVGGTEARPGEVALSLRRLAAPPTIYPDERVAVVEAGVTLQTLQEAAAAHGLEPGIDLAARGSATIGGMVSTNAGGIMAHRHGVMRHRVLGLEAVLADGSLYSDLTRVVKTTAGYDLKHLFIGSEGTLGVITRVALKLEPLPGATVTALLGLPDVAAALAAISLALTVDGGRLRAAEAMWRPMVTLMAESLGWSEPALPLEQPLYLLLSLDGHDRDRLAAAMDELFATILARCPDATGIVATSARQEADLWRLREDTDRIYRRYPAAPSYDVSVPLSEIAGYVARVTDGLAALGGGMGACLFGHLADGNLHIILHHAGALDPASAAAVERLLYADLARLGGSFAAEHGVGAKRISALAATANPAKLATMRRVKAALDPELLLNPGKVLPLPLPDSEAPR